MPSKRLATPCGWRGLSKLNEHREVIRRVTAEVQKPLGEDTYTLKVGERLYGDRHHSLMKPGVLDPRGKLVELNYARTTLSPRNTSTTP